MPKNSTTFEFKGLFDVSDIISKVKTLRTSLAQSGAKNEDILGVDNSIKKMEQLQSKISQLKKGGYSSNADIRNVVSTYQEIFDLARQINSTTENIRLNKVNSNVGELRKNLDAAKEAARQLGQSISSEIATSLGKFKNNRAISNLFVEGAKTGREYRDVVADINLELDKQIQAQKENVRVANELVAAAEKEKATKITENLKDAGLGKLGINSQSFREIGADKNSHIDKESFKDVQAIYNNIIANSTRGKALNEFKKQLKEIGIEFKNQDTILKALDKSFDLKNSGLSTIDSQMKALSKDAGKAEAVLKTLQGQAAAFSGSLQGSNAEVLFDNLFDSTSRATDAQRALNDAVARLKNGEITYKEFEQAIRNSELAIKDEARAAEVSIKTNEAVESVFGRMTRAFERYFSATYIIRKVLNVVKQTFDDIQKLDKAFASIAMVTDKTVGDLWGSYGEYQEIANKLGQSTESAIKASALYYQQGLDTAEALKLTEDTMKLATLAGADFETATRQMTAALRGFNMEMAEGSHVTDVYSELAANAAADVNGIAYAMSKAASIASSSGMSFENTAAFITNMINVALCYNGPL